MHPAHRNYLVSSRHAPSCSVPRTQLVQEFRGHAGKPRRVAFSTQRLVMASACHAVALWTYVPS